MTRRPASPARNALLAPEMASHGGAQAYMWRLYEVLEEYAAQSGGPRPALWSLNDNAQALRRWRDLPDETPVIAGEGSKAGFSLALLQGRDSAPVEHVIVGLIGLAPLAWLLRARRGIRGYSLILHGIEAWRPLGWSDRLACQGAECIIATTHYTARRFAEANGLDSNRISVIPLCASSADPSHPAHAAPSGTHAPPDPDPDFRLSGDFKLGGEFKVLSVGRQSAQERYKGFDELILATRALSDQGVPVHLHLVGQGDDQPRLQAFAAQLELTSRVTFHGQLDDPTLQAAYAQCDLFALPSAGEGFGIVFLEAMRYAKPCIGARAGGIPEVVAEGKTGLLVDAGDAPALAAALHQLWYDPAQREQLGQAGRERLQNKFSPERFKRQHLALIGQ